MHCLLRAAAGDILIADFSRKGRAAPQQEGVQPAVTRNSCVACCILHAAAGDILIFLTGQAEIDKAVTRLNKEVCNLPEDSAGELLVLPLYAALPPELQLRVFRPAQPGVRRCIVATNVAETSITGVFCSYGRVGIRWCGVFCCTLLSKQNSWLVLWTLPGVLLRS
jgi:hypothetical protein